MITDEAIREAAEKYAEYRYVRNSSSEMAAYNGFFMGAHWAMGQMREGEKR